MRDVRPTFSSVNLGTDVARRDGVVVLTPLGDLDLAAVPGFRQSLIKVLAAGDDHIVVSLSSVDFCDSTGLGALIGGLKRARALGGDLVLCSLNDGVRSLMELCDLDRVFVLHQDVDDAIAALQARPAS